MSDRRLSRDQLAKFLPSHETIKAFEQLFTMVNDLLPATDEELAAILGSVRRGVDSQSSRRYAEEQAATPTQKANFDPIIKRIEAMEAVIQQRKQNNSELMKRLETIEQLLGIPS